MSKVSNIFDKKDKEDSKKEKNEEGYDFEAAMKAADERKKKQAEERKKGNRGVIRSHRLKN